MIQIDHAIWALRSALEKESPAESMLRSALNEPAPLSKAKIKAQVTAISKFESQLWEAAKWVVEGAGHLLQEILSRRQLSQLSEEDARILMVGELQGDYQEEPFGIDRWLYWKQRFAELAALLDRGSDIAHHIHKAIHCMALAEKRIDADAIE
jgi:hypothetical protein